MTRVRALAALALLALSGCFHEDPPLPERSISIWAIELSGGTETHEFDLAGGEGYWRVDLSARSQEAVRYVSYGPDGVRRESEPSGGFPFTHSLRVDSPAGGRWNLTISAARVIQGTLQILVPE